VEQVGRVVGQLVEREAVEVRHRVLQPWEGGVVERVHLLHRAREPHLVPLVLGGQAPLRRERLEVGELGRQQRGTHQRAISFW
jgi:hypothetical protein